MRRKLAAGNWKMNGTQANLSELDTLCLQHRNATCEILICPPAQLLAPAQLRSGTIHIGGQDCHTVSRGAFTGDISALMIADTGATYVIVGHSERRSGYGETNELVRAKAEAAQDVDLTAIVCIGETLEEREAGQAIEVLTKQLSESLPDTCTGASVVVAYEPIWAIGTGKIPTFEEIALVHAALRTQLVKRFGTDGQVIRLLYGGSVNKNNAADIFAIADVDGALVGGASLKASDFTPIIEALDASV
jgi:triosephosphate isomerase